MLVRVTHYNAPHHTEYHMAHHTMTHNIIEVEHIRQIQLGEREERRLDLNLGGFVDIDPKP
jgi:hypothetical protein